MMRRTSVRQAIHIPAVPWLTRALLVLYLGLSASLDLHHNHGSPQPAQDPAIRGLESCACAHPCPVELFQNAHGPTAALVPPLALPAIHPAPPLPPVHAWPGGIPRLARPRGPPASS